MRGYSVEISILDEKNSLHVKLCGAEVVTKRAGMLSLPSQENRLGRTGRRKEGIIEEGELINCSKVSV